MFNNLANYLLGTTSSVASYLPFASISSAPPTTSTSDTPTAEHRACDEDGDNSITSSATVIHRVNNSPLSRHNRHRANRGPPRQQQAALVLHRDGDGDDPHALADDDWVFVEQQACDSEGNSEISSSDESDSDNWKVSLRKSRGAKAASSAPTATASASDSDCDRSDGANVASAVDNDETSDADDIGDLTHLLMTRSQVPPTEVRRRLLHGSNSGHKSSASSSALSSSPASVTMPSMDESWFLTPPPCFTSAGPVHMETSPLENLLIEHPSMSVYQSASLLGGSNVDDDDDDSVESAGDIGRRGGVIVSAVPSAGALLSVYSLDESSSDSSFLHVPQQRELGTGTGAAQLAGVVEQTDVFMERLKRQLQQRREICRRRLQMERDQAHMRQQHHAAATLAAGHVHNAHLSREDMLRQQEAQRMRNKEAQKVQIQKRYETLKRGCLDRTNKAREVNFRNQRGRRGERSQGACRSYANNNRKC